MKQCTYCGAELAEEATYCAVCGQPTQQPAAQVETESLFAQTEAVPIASEEAMEAAPFVCEMPCAPKKKTRWPWIVAGIVLLVAAIAALYFFVLRKPEPTPPTPKESLTAAIEATISDFKDLFGKAETLRERIGKLEALRKQSSHISADFTVDGPDGADSGLDKLGIKIEGNLDAESDVLAEGEILLSIDMYENELPLSFRFSVDREELQLSLPKYLDGVYSIPYEDLMDLLDLDEEDFEPLFETLESKESGMDAEALEEQLRQLWETTVFTEITDTVTEIPVEGDAKLYACYEVVFDKEAFRQVFDIVTEMRENGQLIDAEHLEIESVIFHVYDGKVVGLEAISVLDGKNSRDDIWLKGENNPWERIEISSGYTITTESSEQGFCVELAMDGNVLEFDYNDADCTFVIRKADEEGQKISLSLNDWEDGVKLTLAMQMDDVNLSLSMGIASMAASPEVLSEDAESLLTMSDRDFEELLMKVLVQLASDPETEWILDAMQGIAA